MSKHFVWKDLPETFGTHLECIRGVNWLKICDEVFFSEQLIPVEDIVYYNVNGTKEY